MRLFLSIAILLGSFSSVYAQVDACEGKRQRPDGCMSFYTQFYSNGQPTGWKSRVYCNGELAGTYESQSTDNPNYYAIWPDGHLQTPVCLEM